MQYGLSGQALQTVHHSGNHTCRDNPPTKLGRMPCCTSSLLPSALWFQGEWRGGGGCGKGKRWVTYIRFKTAMIGKGEDSSKLFSRMGIHIFSENAYTVYKKVYDISKPLGGPSFD